MAPKVSPMLRAKFKAFCGHEDTSKLAV